MPHSNISVFIPHSGCPNQCSFCNQRSITGFVKEPTPNQVKQICEKALQEIKDKQNTEIAFFGGSFTAIKKSYMISLLETASAFTGEDKFYGIRISTRPDYIDQDVLQLLKRYSVTSIELGAQSMSDEILSANLRGHSSENVRKASNMIKQYGFELGLQMMTGLYKSTPSLDLFTADEIIKLSPDTVRIYPTVILKNTMLEELFLNGKYSPYTLEESIELCSELIMKFEQKCIRIIKLGLHASELVESEMIGGTYHPAFRELCESRIFYSAMYDKLIGLPKAQYVVFVSKSSVSKAIGQKKINIEKLKKIGYDIKIMPCDKLNKYEILIAEEGTGCT